MNLFSFTDELMKISAVDALVKKHASSSLPTGMVGDETMPESDLVRPDEVSSRIPLTVNTKPQVAAGLLGAISVANHPVDQIDYDRPYGYKR